MRFRGSQFYSVDAFLEKNPDCVDLGKLLIADCLKSHEDENRLFPPHNPGGTSTSLTRWLTRLTRSNSHGSPS